MIIHINACWFWMQNTDRCSNCDMPAWRIMKWLRDLFWSRDYNIYEPHTVIHISFSTSPLGGRFLLNCQLLLEQQEYHFVLIDVNPWQNASGPTAQEVCAAQKENRHGTRMSNWILHTLVLEIRGICSSGELRMHSSDSLDGISFEVRNGRVLMTGFPRLCLENLRENTRKQK